MKELLQDLRIDRRHDRPIAPRHPWWRRKIVLAAAGTGCVAVSASAYFAGARPLAVETVVASGSATPSLRTVLLTAGGYVRDARVVYVAPRVAGRVVSLLVREGDRVAAGSLIALLDTRDLAQEVDEAGANCELAAANLRKLEAGSRPEEIAESQAQLQALTVAQERAERELTRSKALFADGLVTAQALDQVETEAQAGARKLEAARQASRLVAAGPRREDIDSGRAALQAARAHLLAASNRLSYTRVVAPVAGRVLRKFRNVGDFVSPDVAFIEGYETVAVGSPIVSLAAAGEQEVSADINESDIAKVALGQSVEVSPNAYPEDGLRGTVTQIAPRADRNKNTVEVKVTLRDAARVLPYDLSVKLSFLGEAPATTRGPAIRIPAAALRRQGGRTTVFIVSGSRAASRSVDIAPGGGDEIVVTGGLSAGEQVIVGSPRGLEEGVLVRAR